MVQTEDSQGNVMFLVRNRLDLLFDETSDIYKILLLKEKDSIKV